MRIGEAAELTGVTISSIRFYERKGLLAPLREEESKYRDYTEEDVIRIKQILLYRKMGIPVESIYLLLNGQTDLKEAFLRQKTELESQMETLQGALDLCNLMIKEQPFDDNKLDQYLNYVKEEEKNGKQFAEIKELMEDMAEFSKISAFRADPYVGTLFRNPWLAVTVNTPTILLPWIPSLLAKDPCYLLPLLTVCVQIFPQVLPYLGFFKHLKRQKMRPQMLFFMIFANGWFSSMLPAGIGLYYLVSGIFSALEQTAFALLERNKENLLTSL